MGVEGFLFAPILVCSHPVTWCCCPRWPDHSFSQTAVHLLRNQRQHDDGMPRHLHCRSQQLCKLPVSRCMDSTKVWLHF